MFGNPGSTEIPFLTDFPDDLEFVLGLHEGAVVGMATGYALGTGRPAFVNLHTAPGLGNAVNAIACARDNRHPARDRGRPAGPAPALARPVPDGRNARAARGRLPGLDDPAGAPRARFPARSPAPTTRRPSGAGPAIVVVPMGDWDEPRRRRLGRPGGARPAAARAGRSTPASVDGARRARRGGRRAGARRRRRPRHAGGLGGARSALAERLACPVWQDTFSSRAGFPQDHPQFAGHLPWRRSELRELFAGNDLVLAVGHARVPAVPLRAGPARRAGHARRRRRRRPRRGAAQPAATWRCSPRRPPSAPSSPRACRSASGTVEPMQRPAAAPPPAAGEPLRAAHVVAALAERLPRRHDPRRGGAVDPARDPRAHRDSRRRSASSPSRTARSASGSRRRSGCGWRCPDRPVVALLGDGSSMYSIQALWSAAHYGVGVVVRRDGNGRYAVHGRARRRPRRTGRLAVVRRRSSSPRSPRGWAARRGGSRRTTSSSARSTRRCPRCARAPSRCCWTCTSGSQGYQGRPTSLPIALPASMSACAARDLVERVGRGGAAP